MAGHAAAHRLQRLRRRTARAARRYPISGGDMSDPVRVERNGPVTTVILDRPEARNAVNGPTATGLFAAFEEFDREDTASVAGVWGGHGAFCPARGLAPARGSHLRVAEDDAVFGVFCRRWGVPLIDGGTIRLPRLIGQSRAMDMILTGRAVDAAEALTIGLANRVVPKGQAREAAEQLAAELAALPQQCMRSDRLSALHQWGITESDALDYEFASISRVAAEAM